MTADAHQDRPSTLAVGLELHLLASEDGGRRTALLDPPGGAPFRYRPNWGLPTMAPPEQSGAPVFGLSAERAEPGGPPVRAVAVAMFPATVPRWIAEVVPGVVLPMYEGARVVGHGTVLWTRAARLPVDDGDATAFRDWLDGRAPDPRPVQVVEDPSWLPAGSRAEVWADGVAPRPTGLVRLLVRRPGAVFCRAREDGRTDLPTVPVEQGGTRRGGGALDTSRAAVDPDGSRASVDPDGSRAALALAEEVLGGPTPAWPVGYVRNVVLGPDAAEGYPWPVPLAHFTVWEAEGAPVVDGEWVPTGPNSPLADRHWFPLLDALG